MSRPIKLYPGSDVNVFMCSPWLGGIFNDANSREMWIDFHALPRIGTSTKQSVDMDILDQVDSLVVFDFFHGEASLETWEIDWVRKLSEQRPLVWLTTNTKLVLGVRTARFDYYWNRTKIAYFDGKCFHQQAGIENFQQYPIHINPRSQKFLSYHSRNTDHRQRLQQCLQRYAQGFLSSSTNYLHPNRQILNGSVFPPARKYFDESYISCLVETQCVGANSILISEKTYDHLIQGRPVLNFATAGFYQQLAADGWQLPTGVDWSWDTVVDDHQRMTDYLAELNKLLSMDLDSLHQWFLENMSCWHHNHAMLRTKSYDIVDTSCY